MLRRALVGLSLSSLVVGGNAFAEGGDGLYGRMEGDASFVLGVDGGTAGGRKLLGGDLRLRYLETAGLVFGYDEFDALKKTETEGDLRRAFRAGVELRPLFPARFLKNREVGYGFVDLMIDSIGLDIGALWSARQSSSVQRAGLYAGLAFEIPLAAKASGAWIRVAGQYWWSAPKLEGDSEPSGRVFAFTVGLAWHQIFGAHLVDRRDQHLQ